MNTKSHWEKIYSSIDDNQLGWYEADPVPSLELIEQSGIQNQDRILHIGAGTSLLIDRLMEKGFNNQVVSDISGTALNKIYKRLGKKNKGLIYCEEDIINPKSLYNYAPFDLWHDRAVLHFLVGVSEREKYFDFLRSTVSIGGFVIIAAFSLSGSDRCSGLPVYRYDADMLTSQLGPSFDLDHSFEYEYKMPSGELRPYIYSMFHRMRP